MDQALSESEFTEELAKFLESQGYNIKVDMDKLYGIYVTGEDVDSNIYQYVNNINGRKVDEEAIFYNKLHEGYATIMSGFVSKHLSEYSAECAAKEIREHPTKFYGFMKLMDEPDSRRAPAEFIVDNARAHVSVRLPYPELTNVAIDYSNVKKILFKDDVFNGSYKQGEELAMKQLGQGDLLIKKEFASNEHFYLNAQETAISTIQCLIRELNPKVENLTIDVEFY